MLRLSNLSWLTGHTINIKPHFLHILVMDCNGDIDFKISMLPVAPHIIFCQYFCIIYDWWSLQILRNHKFWVIFRYNPWQTKCAGQQNCTEVLSPSYCHEQMDIFILILLSYSFISHSTEKLVMCLWQLSLFFTIFLYAYNTSVTLN